MELNARLQSILQSVAIEPEHRECLTLIESQENKRYEVTGSHWSSFVCERISIENLAK